MREDLVRMEHINKFYGRVQALDDVNFSVSRHEIVGLLGDNGAGKSTLMRILAGVTRPDRGEMLVDGAEIHLRDLGHFVRGDVRLLRDGAQHRDALGRRLEAALAELVLGTDAHRHQ